MKHGTYSTYKNHRCRCDECREANRTYMQTKRAHYKGTLAPSAAQHGTDNGYTSYGCRCGECRAAHAIAMRSVRGSSVPRG